MHATEEKLAGYVLAFMLALGTGGVYAATQSVGFLNNVEMNYGFFFSDDVNDLQFTDLTFAGQMNAWNNDVLTAAAIVYSGPTVQPFRGRMRLTFDYQVPQVSVQWAAVLFDGVNYAIQNSGSIDFDSTVRPARAWSTTNAFSGINAQFVDDYFNNPGVPAVPLPKSAVFMLSAVAFLGFTRRGSTPGSELIQTSGGS